MPCWKGRELSRRNRSDRFRRPSPRRSVGARYPYRLDGTSERSAAGSLRASFFAASKQSAAPPAIPASSPYRAETSGISWQRWFTQQEGNRSRISPRNGLSMEETPPPTIMTSGSSRSTMLPNQNDSSSNVSRNTSRATASPAETPWPTMAQERLSSFPPARSRRLEARPSSSLARALRAIAGPEARTSMQPDLPQPQRGPL